ncbi:MAG: beta-lactamase family protein [Pseudonocardia sp.]|nr:beta-lactamase family protein [Pseudonocardia sp.]
MPSSGSRAPPRPSSPQSPSSSSESKTGWHYSNTNYVLAALIIERATGLDWQEQVEHRIVRPLELRHTYATGTNPFIVGPHAHSYVTQPGTAAPIDLTDSSLGHAGDAGLVSTTADLTTFFRSLAGGKLLPPALLAQMQATVPADNPPLPGGRYGLGLQWAPLSCGGRCWYHPGGGTGGFNTWNGVTDDGTRTVRQHWCPVDHDEGHVMSPD